MENTLYYTFSTIAQSLAGAIAFLGAFVLFRLQAISQLLRSSTDLLARAWMGDIDIQRTAATIDYGAFLARAQQLVRQPVPSGWGLIHQATLESMQTALTQRAAMLQGLKAALAFAALVIVLAVAVLAAVERFASPPSLAVGILAGGVLIFAASIFTIGELVWKVAHDA